MSGWSFLSVIHSKQVFQQHLFSKSKAVYIFRLCTEVLTLSQHLGLWRSGSAFALHCQSCERPRVRSPTAPNLLFVQFFVAFNFEFRSLATLKVTSYVLTFHGVYFYVMATEILTFYHSISLSPAVEKRFPEGSHSFISAFPEYVEYRVKSQPTAFANPNACKSVIANIIHLSFLGYPLLLHLNLLQPAYLSSLCGNTC
jgi:hypothetical protein